MRFTPKCPVCERTMTQQRDWQARPYTSEPGIGPQMGEPTSTARATFRCPGCATHLDATVGLYDDETAEWWLTKMREKAK